MRALTKMMRTHARWLRLAMALTAAASAALAAPAPARAQGVQTQQQTIDQVVQLNREGVALYQKKKYEQARKVLKQALELCEAAGLDRHPVAARTHIHLGILIVGGFGQREIGGKQFTAALQIQPDITLTPGVASPAVEDAFNEALVAVTPRTGAAPVAAAEPARAEAAAVEPAADDTPAPQAQSGEEPAPARRAHTDSAGDARDDVPRAERRAANRDDEADEDGDDDAAEPRSRIQLGALLGAGVGWASGMGDVNADTPVSGSFTAAKLGHVVAEAGYWMTPNLMLSLQGRFQKVSGPTEVQANGRTYEPASSATAVFAAATWSPAAIAPHLRPFLSAAVGGGRIRHVVTLSGLHDCGAAHNETCVDTVGAGPFLAGVGGGLHYELGEHLGLVAAINTQIGAPRFTFNVDFNAGVAFHL